MGEKITIKDVAKKTNVSIATVSRVLNNRARVSEKTRKYVIETAERMGYLPDQIARTMVMNRTNSIALFVPSFTIEYWAEVAQSVQSILWEEGYSLFLASTNIEMNPDSAAMKGRKLIGDLIQRRVDGIIYGGSVDHISSNDKENIELLTKNGIHTVSFENRGLGIDTVCCDHLKGIRLITEHLSGKGHVNVAMVNYITDKIRMELFINCCKESGLIIEGENIAHSDFHPQNVQQATREILKRKDKFTAIFCWNDHMAFSVIRELFNQGLKIPEDMAIIGYDGTEISSLFHPSISTVKQPLNEMGEASVHLLLDKIHSNGSPSGEETLKIFKPTFISRESSI